MDAKTLTINGNNYEWRPESGVDPNAVLELKHMIIKMAFHVLSKARYFACDIDDLLQIGYIGAIKYAKTYNPQETRTFASWCKYGILSEFKIHFRRAIQPYDEAYDLFEGDAVYNNGEEDAITKADVNKALRGLKRWHKALLCLLLGLNDTPEMTCGEIASKFGIKDYKRLKAKTNTALAKARVSLLGISMDEALAMGKGIHIGRITTLPVIIHDRKYRLNKIKRESKTNQAA